MAKNPVDNPAPQTISADDVDILQETLLAEPFDYDEELYLEELNEFEDSEVAAVNALPYPVDDEFPPDRPVVTGSLVPVIYEDPEVLFREAHYVNGQFQYTVNLTVTNVPGAIDYEIRVTAV